MPRISEIRLKCKIVPMPKCANKTMKQSLQGASDVTANPSQQTLTIWPTVKMAQWLSCRSTGRDTSRSPFGLLVAWTHRCQITSFIRALVEFNQVKLPADEALQGDNTATSAMSVKRSVHFLLPEGAASVVQGRLAWLGWLPRSTCCLEPKNSSGDFRAQKTRAHGAFFGQ